MTDPLHKPAIAIRDVVKNFGDFQALKGVTFDIAGNEFFTLLGPSGCGKTTLLRLIAGFEAPTAGQIALDGNGIAALPPNQRPINTVFQQYALFPHMSVIENIAFGLEMLGWPRTEIEDRCRTMLAMVKLEAFAERRPSQLSGGQQQRVALARAMAPRPKVLLLDEPLSALDLKLRQAMRSELKALQRETGITFIFVTHDQEEALSMSDRVAVMSEGEVQQIGAPAAIYEEPANRFVADFIGETNLLDVEIIGHDKGALLCRLADGEVLHGLGQASKADKGWLSIRPERLHLQTNADGEALHGHLESAVYLGTDMQYTVRLSESLLLTVRMQNSARDQFHEGQSVSVSVDPGAARYLAN